jgi:pimeloyl-ACP methyl ester carboxylesterase
MLSLPLLLCGAEVDVTIPNPAAAGVTLAGTLSEPDSAAQKLPAVLLVSGAGPHDRNAAAAGHKPFLTLSNTLVQRGFAVLRVDDRGTGKSSDRFEGATTADLSTDAAASLEFLRSRSEIDPARIGILGHGEGAIIAAMLASKDPQIAFLVLLACPAVPGMDVLLAQTMQAENASGLPQEQIEMDAEIGSALYKLAAQGKSADEMRSALKRMSHDVPEFSLAAWKAQVPRLTNPWLRFFLNYNPATALEHVNSPVLALYGGRDLEVIAEQNAPEMDRTLKKAHNRHATVLVLPDLNYMFQKAKTGLGSEYQTIPEDISEVALHDIGLWLSRTAGEAGSPAGTP